MCVMKEKNAKHVVVKVFIIVNLLIHMKRMELRIQVLKEQHVKAVKNPFINGIELYQRALVGTVINATYTACPYCGELGSVLISIGDITKHDCPECSGTGGIRCTNHNKLKVHNYCLHTADDADHKWHYTREK